jgi:DeoR/GlpR family transcriptional regulator of sugar metabolism
VFTHERRQVILSALAVHGSVSVADLSRMVGSSEITVRRDLRALAESGMLVRRRGGATVARSSMDEPSFLEKAVVAADEKLAIAREAATLVDDGDVIMLCAGTTTQALAGLLTRRRLVVATNSLLVATALCDAPHVEVVLLGGLLRGTIRAVIGGDAEKAIARLKFQKVFLSGNGLSADNGLSTPNAHVASIDRAAVDSAARVIGLVDHTKVGVDSMVQTVPLTRLATVITDDGADAAEVERLRESGVEVRVVSRASGMTFGDGRSAQLTSLSAGR